MALLAIEAYPTATLRCDPWHSSWRRFGVVETMNIKQLDGSTDQTVDERARHNRRGLPRYSACSIWRLSFAPPTPSAWALRPYRQQTPTVHAGTAMSPGVRRAV